MRKIGEPKPKPKMIQPKPRKRATRRTAELNRDIPRTSLTRDERRCLEDFAAEDEFFLEERITDRSRYWGVMLRRTDDPERHVHAEFEDGRLWCLTMREQL